MLPFVFFLCLSFFSLCIDLYLYSIISLYFCFFIYFSFLFASIAAVKATLKKEKKKKLLFICIASAFPSVTLIRGFFFLHWAQSRSLGWRTSSFSYERKPRSSIMIFVDLFFYFLLTSVWNLRRIWNNSLVCDSCARGSQPMFTSAGRMDRKKAFEDTFQFGSLLLSFLRSCDPFSRSRFLSSTSNLFSPRWKRKPELSTVAMLLCAQTRVAETHAHTNNTHAVHELENHKFLIITAANPFYKQEKRFSHFPKTYSIVEDVLSFSSYLRRSRYFLHAPNILTRLPCDALSRKKEKRVSPVSSWECLRLTKTYEHFISNTKNEITAKFCGKDASLFFFYWKDKIILFPIATDFSSLWT